MKWQDISVDIKTLSLGIVRPCPCIKSDFKEIFFKLATNDQSDKMFLLTSYFIPKGSAPALGIYIHV